ncbi:hypothetical protein MLD38_009633 [Melastoma candidum]|uniref:Uncharacterized protein n=1 Tax=Melastoma candidum TaxID=119954 RepID=A0ACB9RZG0_9MYRT|nr:hypothetical protein MLD38_009633 [Melastoma candidum]
MKRMDLFCTSSASTAICTSLDHRSVVRHGTKPQAHLHADRVPRYPRSDHLPRIVKTQVPIPCTSYQLAITPRPKSHRDDGDRTSEQARRESSADASDVISLSPPGSPRYFLSDKPFVEPVSEPSRCTALVPVQPARHPVNSDGSPSVKASCSARTRDQVVVLRVSLHCKGCESKVRKHLSRMEGVRSFSIDGEKKVVTVKGEVTPLSLLESVSRVMKNTQLLSPSPSLS